MATPIEMPKLGNTVEECILARWAKHKGDAVAEGELLAEIETDKAAFELNSPGAGTLLETFYEDGDLVPVFSNVCVIGEPGEDVEPFRPRNLPEAPQAEAAPAPAARVIAPAASTAAQQAFLSPRARRFAGERNFEPPAVAGSGPGGRVLEADVRTLWESSPRLSSLARKLVLEGHEVQGPGSGPAGMVLSRDLGEPPVKLSSIRERTARRMRESLASTAQYTLTSSAAAAGLLRLRQKIKAARASGGGLPDININDMVLFCTVQALLKMPEVNSEFIEGKLYRRGAIHLGFACDTARGLLVPVARDCQAMTIAQLAARAKQLADQASAGTISPDDLAGATFTVSNLGNLGIESFTPILNPPQLAILGVNAIGLRPVRGDGKVEFEERIGFSLTCDHQIIDGAPGARFLAVLRECVEGVEELAGLNL